MGIFIAISGFQVSAWGGGAIARLYFGVGGVGRCFWRPVPRFRRFQGLRFVRLFCNFSSCFAVFHDFGVFGSFRGFGVFSVFGRFDATAFLAVSAFVAPAATSSAVSALWCFRRARGFRFLADAGGCSVFS